MSITDGRAAPRDRERRGGDPRRPHRGAWARGPRSTRAFRPKQRLDRPDAILAPGLINTHTHAAMSLFRGIADDLKLQDWLEKFIFPAEAKNVIADSSAGARGSACLEMLLAGTTTFTDMYYFEDVVAEAAKEAGMRGVLGETIIGFPVADAKTPADALAFTEKFLTRFRNDPLIVPAVAPHALYTNSDETLKAVARAGQQVQRAAADSPLRNEEGERRRAWRKRHMTPDADAGFAGRASTAARWPRTACGWTTPIWRF